MDFTNAMEILLPLFEFCTPIALAWAIGRKAIQCCIDVISGRDLNL